MSRFSLRRWWVPLAALLTVALLLVALLVAAFLARHSAPAPASAAARAPVRAGQASFGKFEGPPPALPEDRARRRQTLVEDLKLAAHTYCSYLAGSRYPVGSRPMLDNADQNTPNAPVLEANPMRLDGGGTDADVQLHTSQSRVYMASNEAVAFSLQAVDGQGKVLPLAITRAQARGITYGASRPAPQVPVPFTDDGAGADTSANDGRHTGVLAPAQTGLAGFNGTIRTEVRYNVGGKNGTVLFDVIYTPELPAVWSGPVREAVENGSLSFYLQAEVRMPGRYVVKGRVDDARGQPFALLTFNDVLGPGPNEVKLTVFGKLMRDQDAAMPLRLRDVDGYLLKENTDPDRALMPRLEGRIHTSKTYALDGFSDAEWESEERSRYLAEFSRDLAEARRRLAAFDPGAPLPPSECRPVQGTASVK